MQLYRFGPFELDARSAELRKFGARIKLQDQPRQILLLLMECPGETISREQIRKHLWPDNTFVDFDNAINSAVWKLREALGDTAESPRYIETQARRGYRFLAPLAQEALVSSPQKRPDVQPRLEAAGAGSAIRGKWRFAGLAAAFLLCIGLAALATKIVDMSSTKSRADLRVTPLTSNPGLELHPSFSPDATRVAYAWTTTGQQSAIYVKLNGPGDPVKISKDLPRVFSPAWSPDGRWIAAMQDLGQTGGILLIPAGGGQSRLLARVIKAERSADTCAQSEYQFICGIGSSGSVLAWSSDGRYLFTSAETAPNSPLAIVRVSAETGELQPITSPPKDSGGDFGPSVSPDGHQLAFTRFRSVKTGDLYVLSLAPGNSPNGDLKRITTDGADVHTPAWTSDSRELIFSSDRGGRRELWRVLAAGGSPVRLDGVGEDAFDLAVSQNGRTLIYNRGHYTGSLWKIPISAGRGGEPVRVTATTARDKFSQLSSDGTRIVFESGRSGVDEIWTCDADGANALQLTSFGRGVSGSPRWSPNGNRIAFDSNVGGSFGIYVIQSDGGQPVLLTKNPSTNAVPAWSRDGQWIYFTSSRTGRAEVWKIRANGESETQVTTEGGGLATESVDRRYLYFVRGDESQGDLFRMPIHGGDATKVLSAMKGRLFTVFSRGIYFAAGSPQVELRYLEFATGSIRVIAPLTGLPHADVSADERWVVYPQPAMSDTNLFVVANFH